MAFSACHGQVARRPGVGMKKLEIHMIQTAGPSAFNLDRNGGLKSTVQGNTRRVRVSEQSQGASRRAFGEPSEGTGVVNSRVIAKELEAMLDNREGSGKRIRAVFDLLDINLNVVSATEERLSLQTTELHGLANVIEKYWDVLMTPVKEHPNSLLTDLKAVLPLPNSDDLIIGGRLIMKLPDTKVLKALRFADAISVHPAPFETDAFTTRDDLGDKYRVHAAHIGQRPFASATFYRYALFDADRAERNLSDKNRLKELTAHTLSSVFNAPFGSRDAAEATQPPLGFVLVCFVKRGSPFNYSYIFSSPPSATTTDMNRFAVYRLARAYKETSSMYGSYREIETFCHGSVMPPIFKPFEMASLPAMVDKIIALL